MREGLHCIAFAPHIGFATHLPGATQFGGLQRNSDGLVSKQKGSTAALPRTLLVCRPIQRSGRGDGRRHPFLPCAHYSHKSCSSEATGSPLAAFPFSWPPVCLDSLDATP